jgi:hypothetical protein
VALGCASHPGPLLLEVNESFRLLPRLEEKGVTHFPGRHTAAPGRFVLPSPWLIVVLDLKNTFVYRIHELACCACLHNAPGLVYGVIKQTTACIEIVNCIR